MDSPLVQQETLVTRKEWVTVPVPRSTVRLVIHGYCSLPVAPMTQEVFLDIGPKGAFIVLLCPPEILLVSPPLGWLPWAQGGVPSPVPLSHCPHERPKWSWLPSPSSAFLGILSSSVLFLYSRHIDLGRVGGDRPGSTLTSPLSPTTAAKMRVRFFSCLHLLCLLN